MANLEESPILLALFVIAGLCGLADFSCRRVAGDGEAPRDLDRVAWIYVWLLALSSLLATRTWVKSPFVEWTCLTVLGLGAGLLIREATKPGLSFWRDASAAIKILAGVCVGALVLDVVHASLPLYRYDQWTYHLVVAKWISNMGSLTPPVTYDHIFFTGNYEFLGLLARAVSTSDTFQQGFQNSLSWLLVGVPAALIFRAAKPKDHFVIAGSLAFALLCIFGSGDHEALINAKPDYVLMIMALLLLIFTVGGVSLMSPVLVGFLLVGGLAFKITWLHFAVCGPLIVWGALGPRPIKDHFKVFLGGVTALPCLVPWAMKNWEFFRNPLHPAQSKLFQSTLWSPMLDTYWQKVTLKPHGITAFVENFLSAAGTLPLRWGVTGLVALGFIYFLWREGSLKRSFSRGHVAFTLCMVCYLMVWGIFYGADIFNRFVASAFVFPIAVVWWCSRSIKLDLRALLLLLLPFAVNGQLEVTTARIKNIAGKSFAEFAATADKGPMQKVPDLLALASERAAQFPKAAFTEASLLSDFAFNYYGPSAFWIAGDPVTWWQMEKAGVHPIHGNGMEFLKKMDIRYVWVVDPKIFSEAPPALQNVISQLEPLPSRVGRLYRVH